MKCELVVVGQFKSYQDAALSLEVVEVLRDQERNPGDVLPVKLSQAFAIKPGPRYGDPTRPKATIPRLSCIDEGGGAGSLRASGQGARLQLSIFLD